MKVYVAEDSMISMKIVALIGNALISTGALLKVVLTEPT
jgi:hypothetical protein